MGELLEAMQVGAQIAAQRNQRRAQIEAQRQRQAEAMALQAYRQEQLINQARDDARAEKYAEAIAEDRAANIRRLSQADVDAASNREAIAEDRAANIRRLSQADVDAASNREAIAEDRGLAQKDRSAAAAEKLRTEALAEKFARGVGLKMQDPTAEDESWAGIGGFELPPGQSATDAMAAQMAETGYAPPSVMTELARQDRPGAEVSHEPTIYEKDGYKFYQGRYGPVLIPGQNEDRRNMHQERVKEPGSTKTTTRWVPNEKPKTTEDLAEFYAKRTPDRYSGVPAVTNAPAAQAPSRANNRQGNAPVVKAKPASKPATDGERVRVLDKNGKPFTVFKSKLDAFLKANPDFREE